MPSSEATHLRIYCVCGQKMKVSQDMFGRPGKCIACRQKIRIPTPDEIPPNTTVLYLKDHPEFLRKVKSRPADEEEVAPVPEGEEGKPDKQSVPFEVLDPLRLLCSLEYKAKRQLKALEEVTGSSSKSPSRETDRAELQGKLTRIRSVKADLEEELRQRLMETAIELASAQQKIAELNLAARVGELAFDKYQEQVDRLRRKRDAHERRQTNLRGWLTVEDPYMAGGFMDVSFDATPKAAPRVTLASEPDSTVSLLDWDIEELRHALELRAMAERKLAETQRMRTGAAMSERSLKECRAEAEAERTRARAKVQFCRERLEQLVEDYANDLQTLDAQLDHARGRLKAGRIDRAQFNTLEGGLVRARADLTKARNLATRSLSSNSSDEVPRLHGTFIGRLARSTPRSRATADFWVASAAWPLLFLSLFLPVSSDQSPLELYRTLAAQSGDAHWLVTFPMGTAILIAMVTFIPLRALRGLLLGGIWLVGGLMSAAFLHESAYVMGVVGEHLRAGAPLLERTGVMVYLLAYVALGVATGLGLLAAKETRPVFIAVVLAMALGLAGILSDLGGARVAEPSAEARSTLVQGSMPPAYETTVTVANHGRRMLVIAPDSTMRNAYDFLLESQVGANSWSEAGNPESVEVAGRSLSLSTGMPAAVPVPAGASARFTYRLTPGTYRILLKGKDPARNVERGFTLEAPAAGAGGTATEASQPPQGKPGRTAQPVPEELLREIAPQVILRGIVATPGKPANFSIMVIRPDGVSQANTYTIGQEVFDGWLVREFNPDEQTVTLAKGKNILILRRGQTYALASRQPQG